MCPWEQVSLSSKTSDIPEELASDTHSETVRYHMLLASNSESAESTLNFDRIPEKHLLAAMLERAYWDLKPSIDPCIRRDAIKWFEGRNRRGLCFPYQYVKQILELKYSYEVEIWRAVAEAKKLDTYDQ